MALHNLAELGQMRGVSPFPNASHVGELGNFAEGMVCHEPAFDAFNVTVGPVGAARRLEQQRADGGRGGVGAARAAAAAADAASASSAELGHQHALEAERAQHVGQLAEAEGRMRALEDEGVITAYHAAIDPAKMGFTITVFAMVSLKSQAEDDLQRFEDHVQKLPEVRECYMLNGEIDFMLKVVAKDLQTFQKFLTSQLTAAPNVASVKTSLAIRSAKNLPGVPIGE